jgi:hypothetical protein
MWSADNRPVADTLEEAFGALIDAFRVCPVEPVRRFRRSADHFRLSADLQPAASPHRLPHVSGTG